MSANDPERTRVPIAPAVLENLLLQRQISSQLLQPIVFILQLLQALGLIDVQAAGFPSVPVVALLGVIAASLQAAAMLLPCPCITSICRSFVTICSAANLFLGICLLFPKPCSLSPPSLEKAGQVRGVDSHHDKQSQSLLSHR